MRRRVHSLPRRVRWPLVSMLVALLGLGTLYSGYCYGVWGRNTLLLHYLFQCNCPAASEQIRYSDFTVLVPACRWPEVEAMSGDGRYLIVTEHADPHASYRLDLATGERQVVSRYNPEWGNSPDAPSFWFLTNDLLLTSGKGRRFALVEAPSGTQVPVRWQYVDQALPQFLTVLRSATQIIIANTTAVVLVPDPLQHPDQNLVLYSAVLSQTSLQERLAANGVTTPITRPEHPYDKVIGSGGLMARHAHLWADQDGIHPPNTPIGGDDVVVLQRTGFTRNPGSVLGYSARGWTQYDQAVVYASPVRYVLEDVIDLFVARSYLPVPQPVLLLDAPPVPEGGE